MTNLNGLWPTERQRLMPARNLWRRHIHCPIDGPYIIAMSRTVENEDVMNEIVSDLVQSVQQGNFNSVKEAFQRPYRVNSARSPNSGGSYYLPATAVDKDGISMLQWAAINNRIQIAQFLLERAGIFPKSSHSHSATVTAKNNRIDAENGIDKDSLINMCGGVLKETALQWALRRLVVDSYDPSHCHGPVPSTLSEHHLLPAYRSISE